MSGVRTTTYKPNSIQTLIDLLPSRGHPWHPCLLMIKATSRQVVAIISPLLPDRISRKKKRKKSSVPSFDPDRSGFRTVLPPAFVDTRRRFDQCWPVFIVRLRSLHQEALLPFEIEDTCMSPSRFFSSVARNIARRHEASTPTSATSQLTFVSWFQIWLPEL